MRRPMGRGEIPADMRVSCGVPRLVRRKSVGAPAFLPVFASVSATISSRTLLKS